MLYDLALNNIIYMTLAFLFSEQRTFSGLRRYQLLEISHDILSRELLAPFPLEVKGVGWWDLNNIIYMTLHSSSQSNEPFLGCADTSC